MKNIKLVIFITLCFNLMLVGCIEEHDEELGEVQGYKPTYSEALSTDIQFMGAQPFETPGKIYVYGNYLFVNDRLKGVHIIDNADPANPKNIAFIAIQGNVDIAVYNNVLYADNYADLVAIDVSDINNPNVCDRETNVFNGIQDYPNATNTYFECVDKSKGMVIGWTQTTIQNPKCRR